MKNKKSDVISAISMAIQRRIASHHAGTVIEEEVRVEEEEEEEMSPTLGKEDNHLKEGDNLQDILHIQKEKARRRETETIGRGTTVQVSQVQTRTDLVDLGQDLILTQKQNKTLHQEEKSQNEVKDQTETKADTIRVIEL